jgi:signal transduction histidine kinase
MNSSVLTLGLLFLTAYAVFSVLYYFVRIRPRLQPENAAVPAPAPPASGNEAHAGTKAGGTAQTMSPVLQRALDEWQYTFDAIIDPVLVLDSELRIIKGNRAAFQILSVNGSAIEGKQCYQLFAGADTPCPFCPMQTVRFEKKPHGQEVTHRYLGRTFSVSCSPLCEDDQVVGYVFSAKDISHQRNLEKRLVHAHKLESIATLAGGIAHDFNNILTAVIGYGNLLEMEMQEDDPLHAYVEEILASSEKAVNLTQSLLAFSRKQTISLKHHDINDIISGVENLLKRLLSEDIDLKISLTSPGITVMADITQIQQVLINLATNARDAMPSGGMLSIEAGHVGPDDCLGRSRHGKGSLYAMISVSDTGAGMDQQMRARIFDPFFTTKEVGKGTGLGLSIVYGIVKQHNGFISAYSEENAGTTFHIYLPAVEEKTGWGRPKPAAVRQGSGTILLAEDNPEVRRLATNVLTKTGYNVIEAADGQQAIDYFTANRDIIDLIIVDVVMPRKNGREVMEQVRSLKPDTKVLFTSGYTRDILFDKGMCDPDFNFLAKPLSPHELLQKIEDILTTA